jgi:hypothetical protein
LGQAGSAENQKRSRLFLQLGYRRDELQMLFRARNLTPSA